MAGGDLGAEDALSLAGRVRAESAWAGMTPANSERMATLYRCKAPTDLVCRCGKVARRLRAADIDYDEVRVPFLKRDRPEVEELTGQRWVPVLVHGEEVIHDSHRILEYIDHVSRRRRRPRRRGRARLMARTPRRGSASTSAGRRAWPLVLMAWERWQALSPEEKERYRRQAREAAARGREALERARRRRR